MASSLEEEKEVTNGSETEDNEAIDLGKEFTEQLESLSLLMTSMSHSESLAQSRLHSLTSRQENTLEKLESIERAKFENEQFLKNKLREKSSAGKRNFNKRIQLNVYGGGERQKILEALKACEKQSWMAKEQLRMKIVQVMKLQARLANFEEHQPQKTYKKSKGPHVVVKKQKFQNAMKSFQADYQRLVSAITCIEKRKDSLLKMNFLLRTKIKSLHKEKEILKKENEHFLLENRKILAKKQIQKCDTPDDLTDTQMLIAQLEQENECLKQQLEECKEREALWQMQFKAGEKSQ